MEFIKTDNMIFIHNMKYDIDKKGLICYTISNKYDIKSFAIINCEYLNIFINSERKVKLQIMMNKCDNIRIYMNDKITPKFIDDYTVINSMCSYDLTIDEFKEELLNI